MLDPGCSMLDARCSMLDARCDESLNSWTMLSRGGWADPASCCALRRDESSIQNPASAEFVVIMLQEERFASQVRQPRSEPPSARAWSDPALGDHRSIAWAAPKAATRSTGADRPPGQRPHPRRNHGTMVDLAWARLVPWLPGWSPIPHRSPLFAPRRVVLPSIPATSDVY